MYTRTGLARAGLAMKQQDARLARGEPLRCHRIEQIVKLGACLGVHFPQHLVQRGLKAEGLEMAFWRVALRPGRPMMNGRLGPMHVLGMPGNPVSARNWQCGPGTKRLIR